jgi:hypothetical protein
MMMPPMMMPQQMMMPPMMMPQQMMPPMMPQPMPQQVMPPMMMPQQIMPPAAPIVAPPQHVVAVPGQMPAAPLNSPVSSSPAPALEPVPRTTEGTANPEAGRKVVNLPLDRRRAPAPARNPEAEQQLDFMTELPDIL